ncbi:MAG: Gfo/Idh/MocA family oxidoreductase [Lachnospiraceae bacterium]
MKVCFVGAGSIGKRHIRNLWNIVSRYEDIQIDLLRSKQCSKTTEIEGFVSREYYDVESLDADYDIIFITNPTNLHLKTIIDLQKKANSFFVEKPIFDKYESKCYLQEIDNSKLYYVACPLRYTNVIKEAKKIVKNCNVFSARAISSSYLPDWRSGIDYRNAYSSKKKEGGGVCIDLIHEFDYIISLFGYPEESKMMRGKFSNLEVDCEDLAVYIASYQDKLVEIHLDYFGKETKRELELFTDQGVYRFDIINSSITLNGKTIQEYGEDTNDKYIAELNTFLKMVYHNNENTNDIYQANEVIRLAESTCWRKSTC